MVQNNKTIGNGNTVAPVQQNPIRNTQGFRNSGADFETMLKAQLEQNEASNREEGIQFSKHARERVDQRGIELTDGLLNDLQSAVEKARLKGAKDIVIFDARQAFIVNVPSNTVITAVSEPEMKENIFTNIDSAVII